MNLKIKKTYTENVKCCCEKSPLLQLIFCTLLSNVFSKQNYKVNTNKNVDPNLISSVCKEKI